MQREKVHPMDFKKTGSATCNGKPTPEGQQRRDVEDVDTPSCRRRPSNLPRFARSWGVGMLRAWRDLFIQPLSCRSTCPTSVLAPLTSNVYVKCSTCNVATFAILHVLLRFARSLGAGMLRAWRNLFIQPLSCRSTCPTWPPSRQARR